MAPASTNLGKVTLHLLKHLIDTGQAVRLNLRLTSCSCYFRNHYDELPEGHCEIEMFMRYS